jgi:hypothetical protein
LLLTPLLPEPPPLAPLLLPPEAPLLDAPLLLTPLEPLAPLPLPPAPLVLAPLLLEPPPAAPLLASPLSSPPVMPDASSSAPGALLKAAPPHCCVPKAITTAPTANPKFKRTNVPPSTLQAEGGFAVCRPQSEAPV